jgi:hypothetical protein
MRGKKKRTTREQCGQCEGRIENREKVGPGEFSEQYMVKIWLDSEQGLQVLAGPLRISANAKKKFSKGLCAG